MNDSYLKGLVAGEFKFKGAFDHGPQVGDTVTFIDSDGEPFGTGCITEKDGELFLECQPIDQPTVREASE